MKAIRTDLKLAFSLAVLSAAGLLSVPAHAGLLGNGSFDALVIADGANCPGVALGNSCAEGGGARQHNDGAEVATLVYRGDGQGGSADSSGAWAELTVAFGRDSFASSTQSQGGMDAVALACAASPEVCRGKVYGTTGGATDAGAVAGAGAAFGLGFMQSVAGVQVGAQYGLSFMQTGRQAAAHGAESKGDSSAAPERWEVTYGASSQPAAVTSIEGGSGWSLGGLQFQATSATQVQTYMASGPSGLMPGGLQVAPMLPTPFDAPEPSVLMLVGAAMAGLWMQRRKQLRPD